MSLSLRAARGLSLALALSSAASIGCGGSSKSASTAAGKRPGGPRIVRRFEPRDVLPADLDLVARIDLARMRAQIGPDALDRLPQSALAEAGEAMVVAAIRRADVVWIAVRAAEAASGDRVVVVEGNFAGFRPDPTMFRPAPERDLGGLVAYDRIADAGSPLARSSTARVLVLGDRAVAFVSPVEVDSVARVLREGSDEARGDPAAEGILSIDLRARRLSPALEGRYPSLGVLVAGIERVRATVSLPDDGLRIEGDIVGRTPDGASRVERFLGTLRDAASSERHAKLFGSLRIERLERTARLKWTIPASVLFAAPKSPDEASGPAP